jgi:MFS family permease
MLAAGMAAALAALTAVYVRGFRSTQRPMLDFRLLSVRTFSAGFWGGSLVRAGYGAIPFLLPLALQIGLGYSALQSGYVLLASGIVAFLTKTMTARILRRFGFQKVLFWNGVLCCLGLLGCALFSVSDPGLAWIVVLTSLAGFFRSVQFNALSAISYADLPPAKIASATTLNTMGWQLAIMIGISVSTLAVELASRVRGNATPAGADFSFAFLVVSAIAFITVPIFFTLPRQAGDELRGGQTR